SLNALRFCRAMGRTITRSDWNARGPAGTGFDIERQFSLVMFISPRFALRPRPCTAFPHDCSAPGATVFVWGSEALTPLWVPRSPKRKPVSCRRRPVPRRTPEGWAGAGRARPYGAERGGRGPSVAAGG